MATKNDTERALRATVNEGRSALRELERARAEIEKQIVAVAATIKAAEDALTALGLPIPGKPGRPKAVATPAEVMRHVAVKVAVAAQGFDKKPKKPLSRARKAALERAWAARRQNAAARREAAEKAAHA